MITGLYAAFFALMQIALTRNIIRLRYANKISLGDGGIEPLQTAVRIHGNFTETVPMALILMGIAEFSGAPFWAVHGLGAAMIVSRISHAYALSTPPGYGTFRIIGMGLTFLTYVTGGALCVWLFIASL